MATIEKRYLAPLRPAATITEADRLKLYDLIGKRLVDILTGDQSYFLEGTKKDPRTLSSDLQHLIASLSAMQMQTNDPSNVLGQAVEHLKGHARRFDDLIEENEPTDKIQLPPERTPSTMDKNEIYIDPDPGLYSPPNPLLPQRRSLERRVAADLPNGGAVTVTPESYPQRARRMANSTSLHIPGLNQTVSRQTLELLNGSRPKWPFPPIFDTRW